jgi:hypothetical protein
LKVYYDNKTGKSVNSCNDEPPKGDYKELMSDTDFYKALPDETKQKMTWVQIELEEAEKALSFEVQSEVQPVKK